MSGWHHAFLSERTVRARKRHYCFVCQLSIWPGECYVRSATVSDGSAHSFTEHHVCRSVALDMVNENRFDYPDGYHGEDVRSHLSDLECLDRTIEEIVVWRRCKRAWMLDRLQRRIAA